MKQGEEIQGEVMEGPEWVGMRPEEAAYLQGQTERGVRLAVLSQRLRNAVENREYAKLIDAILAAKAEREKGERPMGKRLQHILGDVPCDNLSCASCHGDG